MSTRQPWFCPSCHKHHGPHVDTCPEPVDAVSTKVMPAIPPTHVYTAPERPWWVHPPVWNPSSTTCVVHYGTTPNMVMVN